MLKRIVMGISIMALALTAVVAVPSAAEAATKAPCAGYKLMESKNIGDLGKILVYQRIHSGTYTICVVNMATKKTAGLKLRRSVTIMLNGVRLSYDNNLYRSYAGPLHAFVGQANETSLGVDIYASITYRGKRVTATHPYSPWM